MRDTISIGSLVEEYRTYASESGIRRPGRPTVDESQRLVNTLIEWGEWTPDGAARVVRLAQECGDFLLRDALALAVALGVEDEGPGF